MDAARQKLSVSLLSPRGVGCGAANRRPSALACSIGPRWCGAHKIRRTTLCHAHAAPRALRETTVAQRFVRRASSGLAYPVPARHPTPTHRPTSMGPLQRQRMAERVPGTHCAPHRCPDAPTSVSSVSQSSAVQAKGARRPAAPAGPAEGSPQVATRTHYERTRRSTRAHEVLFLYPLVQASNILPETSVKTTISLSSKTVSSSYQCIIYITLL